jgi:hypothetical protein
MERMIDARQRDGTPTQPLSGMVPMEVHYFLSTNLMTKNYHTCRLALG